MKPRSLDKKQLELLYSSGKSMAEIAKVSNCSLHKVAYWMKQYDISIRSRSDAMYIKLNPNGDPFLIKSIFSKEEMFLFGLGIGVYWGEGEKASKSAIRVANTDVNVIIAFSNFLQIICGVKKEKIHYSLVCFNDSDPTIVKQYWSKMLAISDEKFGKIVLIPKQGKGTYKRKSQTGVCTLTVSNMKLKAWIMGEINKFKHLPI